MPNRAFQSVAVAVLLVGRLHAQDDRSAHTRQFVTVANDVKLEVLDWGGSGRPVVLLTGFGDTAHVFDQFAPKLATTYHVYGITRRGYGLSSAPASGYSADQLGDDVLAVLSALRLEKPVLVGHSIAGEEMSSIGSRHPERVAGLVYLDAGYSYAYYDPTQEGAWAVDVADLNRKLEQLLSEAGRDRRPLIQELLQTTLPQFERDLRVMEKDRPPSIASSTAAAAAVLPPIALAIFEGEQKYTEIRGPILAIFAIASGADSAVFEEVAKGFEEGVPSARVVRLPGANHYVFRSNETDVLREMNAFISSLR